ncbi:MAG: hypothetical protein GY821_04120 [Gammaproteobacteria bacterium]|nr:hypothetical protein [Gammaproteobacteria bacterium]
MLQITVKQSNLVKITLIFLHGVAVAALWLSAVILTIKFLCDARHGTEFSGESPPWAELKRFTSLDKCKFVRACHEGRYHV